MGGAQNRKRLPNSVGEQVFAEVETLTADGNMKRGAAFEQIATRTGSKPGTVAANFYRVARNRGVAMRPRRSTGSSGSPRGRGSKAIAAVMLRLESLLQAQENELAELRKQNQQLAKLRTLLTK